MINILYYTFSFFKEVIMYNYNFDYTPSPSEGLAAALGGLLAFLGVIIFFAVVIGIVMYIFSSLAYYTIAKNRNIPNPWLAWIPVGRDYLIGTLLDNYYMQDKNENHNFKTWALVCSAVTIGASILVFLSFLAPIAAIATTLITDLYIYNYFKHTYPEKDGLLTVLCIALPVVAPFVLFAQRNNMDVFKPASVPKQEYPKAAPYQQPYNQPYGAPQQPYNAPQQPQQPTYEPAPRQPYNAAPQQPTYEPAPQQPVQPAPQPTYESAPEQPVQPAPQETEAENQ